MISVTAGLIPALVPVLLLALSGCRQSEIRANSDPPPIEVRATVRAAQSVVVTAQVDGRVETVGVREGETIAAATPIASLSNPAIERDAVSTRAQLDWIETRLSRAGRPSPAAPARPTGSVQITAKILELRQQRLQKMRQLRKSNDITARELEHAEIEYLAALRDYNNERRVFAGTPAATDDRELLRIERTKVAAEEKFAQERLTLLQIASPIAGTVTRLYVTPGQAVSPRDPIAEVADVATLHVRGDIAPELLRYVRPGMRVEVKIFGVPARTFADEIEYIVPVQGSGSESRAAAIVVAIPNPDRALQPNTDALITVRSLR